MEQDRLKMVLETQATSYDYDVTMEFITDQCEKLGGVVEWDEHDNIYVTKGNASVYPCVVSHTDTVHEIYKDYKVLQSGGNLFGFDGYTMKQVGVGGDDKVGIWVCLEALREFDNIKVCFFAQEEIGCVGSSKADALFFKDVGYIFECDRKGRGDFVQESSGVKMFGKKFLKAIKPILDDFEYEVTQGGLTDVHELSLLTDLCCANMSCGYYKPHTQWEYVNIKDAMHTKDMVLSLIKKLGEVRYKHKAEDTYPSYYGGYSTYGGGYGTALTKSYPKKSAVVEGKKYCVSCYSFMGSDTTCEWCNPAQSVVSNNDTCLCGGTFIDYNDGFGQYSSCQRCGQHGSTSF
jgi:hypothetical protein